MGVGASAPDRGRQTGARDRITTRRTGCLRRGVERQRTPATSGVASVTHQHDVTGERRRSARGPVDAFSPRLVGCFHQLTPGRLPAGRRSVGGASDTHARRRKQAYTVGQCIREAHCPAAGDRGRSSDGRSAAAPRHPPDSARARSRAGMYAVLGPPVSEIACAAAVSSATASPYGCSSAVRFPDRNAA